MVTLAFLSQDFWLAVWGGFKSALVVSGFRLWVADGSWGGGVGRGSVDYKVMAWVMVGMGCGMCGFWF